MSSMWRRSQRLAHHAFARRYQLRQAVLQQRFRFGHNGFHELSRGRNVVDDVERLCTYPNCQAHLTLRPKR